MQAPIIYFLRIIEPSLDAVPRAVFVILLFLAPLTAGNAQEKRPLSSYDAQEISTQGYPRAVSFEEAISEFNRHCERKLADVGQPKLSVAELEAALAAAAYAPIVGIDAFKPMLNQALRERKLSAGVLLCCTTTSSIPNPNEKGGTITIESRTIELCAGVALYQSDKRWHKTKAIPIRTVYVAAEYAAGKSK